MEKKDLTLEDLKNFANDLIATYNLYFPNDKVRPFDLTGQIGIYDIGAVIGRIGGRLGISIGQPYSIDDLSAKLGELQREIEQRGWL